MSAGSAKAAGAQSRANRVRSAVSLAAHAIFVREAASETARHVGRTPPVFAGRTLSLRAFDADGDLVAAVLADPEEHDPAIRELLVDVRVHHIDAHNAAYGCFAARIERCKEAA